ncbi:uncharacterized protein VTP21DRAFT_8080 [Calcarisporiella thermophila]|uniref:uncharacterized protein n=1 Tax=Calcarisporiella thermophila TaxID=911321 RepID=UPI003743BFEB
MRVSASVALVWGIFSLTVVSALPVFNEVNDFQVDGTKCPLRPKFNQACPLLCVPSLSQCPPSLAPACPANTVFCGDGNCHPSCDGIANACDCGEEVSGLVACATGQAVNITEYDPRDKGLTLRSCAQAANVTGAVDWAERGGGKPAWMTCTPIPFFTWKEPMWIGIWSVLGGEVLLLFTWYAYKQFRERGIRNAKASHLLDESRSVEKESMGEKMKAGGDEADSSASERSSEEELLQFRGFNNDIFGYLCYGSVILFTLFLLALLGVSVADYYGAVTGATYGVFLTSDISMKVFCVVWHITLAWLIVVNHMRHRLQNYFRIEVSPNTGSYVQVERPQDPVILLDDDSKLLKTMRRLEGIVHRFFGSDVVVTTCPVRYTKQQSRRYFEYQCTRFVYNDQSNQYHPYVFELGRDGESLLRQGGGLSEEESDFRRALLGPNFIRVHVPNFLGGLMREFTSFFYVYQMMCLWVWFYFQYYYMGIVQTVVILTSAIVKVIIRLRSEKRVKRMAEHVDSCQVLRGTKWVKSSSADLVPGDVILLKDGTVPCDVVLLGGNAIVDESSLTGESLPVRKFALPSDLARYDKLTSGKSSTLFAGTTVVSTTSAVNVPSANSETENEKAEKSVESEEGVRALVLATGTATEKGHLIHKILFPNPISFVFNEHLKIVVTILLGWGIVAYGLSMWLMGRGDITSWFYAVFVISEILSPLLPAALVVGQSVAATRLRLKGIFCVDLPRIVMAGKVQIFCFDKTGTLTKQGLDFHGVIPPLTSAVDEGKKRVALSMDDRRAVFGELSKDIQLGMVACHSVTSVQGRLIGNPVDIEGFRATGWELGEHTAPYIDTIVNPLASDQKVHILRRFEFVHARASMSVVCLDEKGEVHCFVKGSFERIKQICDPDSIPGDYDEITSRLAMEGCYVLALGHRSMGHIDSIGHDTIQGWTREEVEKEPQFAGLILFRNSLKPDTAQAIAELKRGDTRVVMITGDNARTGIFIARECGMAAGPMVLADMEGGEVVWRDVDSGEVVQEVEKECEELAMTGKAFDALVAQGTIEKYLLRTRVFARMTPAGKVKCVQLHMEKGVTAMCGDGGNDCGALRCAHVGLALSEAEASIVSPFSTNRRSVDSCVELLRQGRSALATSFAGYKFLILYGETMAWWELIMFYFTVIAPQPLWMLIDGVITVGMTLAITQALPARKLGPRRPTARLLAPETILSACGIIFINFWFIIGAVVFLFQQPWFACNEFDGSLVDAAKWWLIGDNFEAEVITLVVIFQFFNSGAIFNFGSTHRRAWITNIPLVIFYAILFVVGSFLILADPNPFSCLFRVNCGSADVLVAKGYPEPWWRIEPYNSPIGHNVLPHDFRWKLWGYCLANMILGLLWERLVILGPVRGWARKMWGVKRRKLKL